MGREVICYRDWGNLNDDNSWYFFDDIGWYVGRVVSAEFDIGVFNEIGSGAGIDRDFNYGIITSFGRGIGISRDGNIDGPL